MIHIYSAKSQPATRFVDNSVDPPARFKNKPHKLVFAECCRQRRRAKNCRVFVYYDHWKFVCTDGCGCKAASPAPAKGME
jgi:hypothetical protein